LPRHLSLTDRAANVKRSVKRSVGAPDGRVRGAGCASRLAFERVMAWFACRFPHPPASSRRASAAAYRGDAEFPPVSDQGMDPCSSRIADVLADSRFRPEAEAFAKFGDRAL